MIFRVETPGGGNKAYAEDPDVAFGMVAQLLHEGFDFVDLWLDGPRGLPTRITKANYREVYWSKIGTLLEREVDE